MPKFRKKPVVITAEQFIRNQLPWPEGVELVHDIPGIDTLEGRMLVSEGDWIITGVDGERYPCKPHIFAATYEAVD